MTEGTSTHGDGLSERWGDAGRDRVAGAARLQLLALSAMGGLALGLPITASWLAAADAGSGGTTALHLGALLAIFAVAATIALRSAGAAAPPAPQPACLDQGAPEDSARLLAQMHHELRTPLNAMLGFSEAMQRELHGPLGHARYQEYVAHISESGGRLLKAAEDALAVAATMSVLMADRRALRREWLPAAALLREAWAAAAESNTDVRLTMDEGGAAEIECDRQATGEALRHLLGEAVARTPPGGAITARSGRSRIDIVVEPVAPARDRGRRPAADGRQAGRSAAGDGLRLVLARSLIEMQGAELNLADGSHAEGWMASIAFRVGEGGQARTSRPSAAGHRWPVFRVHRVDCVPGAAIRASAGSHAVPPV